MALESQVTQIIKKAYQNRIPILGICNGFQILTKMNLLPGFVGPEVEEQIRRNPKSEIGKLYIRNCRLLISDPGKSSSHAR